MSGSESGFNRTGPVFHGPVAGNKHIFPCRAAVGRALGIVAPILSDGRPFMPQNPVRRHKGCGMAAPGADFLPDFQGQITVGKV